MDPLSLLRSRLLGSVNFPTVVEEANRQRTSWRLLTRSPRNILNGCIPETSEKIQQFRVLVRPFTNIGIHQSFIYPKDVPQIQFHGILPSIVFISWVLFRKRSQFQWVNLRQKKICFRFTWAMKKGPPVVLGICWGWNPAQLCRDYFKNHDMRIPRSHEPTNNSYGK